MQRAHRAGTVDQPVTFAMERLAEAAASSTLSDPIHHVLTSRLGRRWSTASLFATERVTLPSEAHFL